jgi:hypothetical protein
VGATVFFASSSELATLSNTFAVGGTPTDPTTVSLTVTSPSGVVTTYTYAAAQITRTTTGVYTKDITCTEADLWQYVWTGTGAASDVTAGTFTVFGTDLQRNYCSLEELKSRLGLASTDTADDFELKLAVESSSRWIEEHCERQFARVAGTRTFEAADAYLARVDDLVSVTTLKTDTAGDGTFDTTWAVTDYQLAPVNPSSGSEQRPYTQVRAVGSYTFPCYASRMSRSDRLQIVGVFGWPAVPLAVKQAALVIAAEHLKMKDAPFGIAGYGEYGPIRVRANPMAVGLLEPYRRYPVLVG